MGYTQMIGEIDINGFVVMRLSYAEKRCPTFIRATHAACASGSKFASVRWLVFNAGELRVRQWRDMARNATHYNIENWAQIVR